ncbi:MAG TPA: 2-hydroxyacyl-CoA dehydratase [Bacillota bacterium]|nr:2-hydroxyacyl-CoA dehydratase [Bacillota bacterium]
MTRRIGITTTVPIEIIYAAGAVPIDLNNIFITHARPQELVEEAEMAGYPRNICGWIKGIYSTVRQNPDLESVVAVTQGDCSNTHALMETLQLQGIRTLPFAYPFDRDADLLKLQMEKMMEYFRVDWAEVQAAKDRLDKIRSKVWELDRLSWQGNQVSGFENHLFQVSCSDFDGDPDAFEARVDRFLSQLERAREYQEDVRLGYIGVPPIVDDVYDFLESQGARVVFNEVQRQFTMPFATADIIEQYRLYTYPYDIFSRIDDINREIETRNLDGIIHYTQSFCFRQIEDIIVREKLSVPILTLEGDKPGKLDARSKMRLEAFVDMLR